MINQEILNLSKEYFDELALKIFQIQARENTFYKKYLEILKIDSNKILELSQVPFLPIQFFKSQIIKTGNWEEQNYFLSSGTSQNSRSVHYIKSTDWYDVISWQIFESEILNFYAKKENEIQIHALLPGYLENPHSSLIHMIRSFGNKHNQQKTPTTFFSNFNDLHQLIIQNNQQNIRTILFGVSFALIDFANLFKINSSLLTVIETGGMKSTHRMLIKTEILNILKQQFPQSSIYSEYGMTELLSQAYALDGVNFKAAKSMKIVITAIDDQKEILSTNKRGRINIVDLANIDTCCFIQTGDAGIINTDGTFQVLGRISEDELRGCNLIYD